MMAQYTLGPTDISGKADKADTVLDTALSRGRKANTIVGTGSFAFGNNVEAAGNYSHAEGNITKAFENYSHAEGYSTTATGSNGAHAEGATTTASGASSHAEGLSVTASGKASHAEGYASTTSTYGAFGKGDHAEGYNTIANSGTSSSYYAAHAEGKQTTATGNAAHAEGTNTTASGNSSHAEGGNATASGNQSHAEGYNTTASASYSHAEGSNTTASEQASHAEGSSTTASGSYSHAEGYQTKAQGNYAHAEGWNTIASYCQHVVGKSNVPNTSNALQWPTDTTNIPEYDPNKDYYAKGSLVKYNGSVYVSHNETSPKRGSPKYDTYNWHSYTSTTTGTEPEWQNETEYAQNTIVKLTDSSGTVTYYQNHNAIVGTRIQVGTNEWLRDWHTQSSGTYPIDPDYIEIVGWSKGLYTNPRNVRVVDHEGNERLAGDLYIHCDDDSTGGTKVATVTDLSAKADKTNPVFTGSISLGRKANTTVAARSLAFGNDVEASNMDSQAFGNNTIASGYASHSEGTITTASGAQSHSEGIRTTASGNNSHSEGSDTIASGSQSHAEGCGGTYTISGTTYTSGAKGMADHSEGYKCLTGTGLQGNHAEGYQTRATGGAAHSEGDYTLASGLASHAEGIGGTFTLNGTTYTSGAKGNSDHAEGYQCLTEQSMPGNHAEGYQTRATGGGAHSEGYWTLASGLASHAEGASTVASQNYAHAEGQQTVAAGASSHVSGQFNVEDSYSNWSEWVANTSYSVGDKVKRTSSSSVAAYICKTANSDSTFTTSKWTAQNGKMNYAEIIGNGLDVNNKSNARALDWDGNERLKGDLYVGCNADSTGGTKVTPLPAVTSSDNGKSLEVSNGSWATGAKKVDKEYALPDDWSTKTWSGLTFFHGGYVWNDGENIYYSNGSEQYILNQSNSAWAAKTWTGLINFNGNNVWTDGENIYYSDSSNQYILNKSTSTWSTKTWTGLVSFYGAYIWTDETNIYYSEGSKQYILDQSTSTWSTYTWTGLTSFNGHKVWNDGENIYYGDGSSTQYLLDKSTSIWSTKTWTGYASVTGNNVWTDGKNIYYSNGSAQYVLNKSTSTWTAKTWTGLTSFYGGHMWADGKNIYYSYSDNQYKFNKHEDQILIGRNGEFSPVPAENLILPAAPSSDGTYILQCSVSSGTATYSWVSLPNASGVSF